MNFSQNSFPPVIIQHKSTGEVLMVGYMNNYAYWKTLQTNKLYLFDKTKHCAFLVGESCSHHLAVKEFYLNQEHNAILIKVIPGEQGCNQCNQPFFTKAKMR